ncbi:hypothetical protein Tco_0580792 [Tanacetum coccineum]
MGYIYDAMSRAKEQISKNLKAGCFLNPAIFHGENSKVDTNNEILSDLYVAIDRLIPDPDENDSVREELNMERYRDDDDEINVGGGLEEEVNALDDLDSDAELLDCN